MKTAIQSLKEKLTSKEMGVGGMDKVAISIVIFVVTAAAGIVALAKLKNTEAVNSSQDALDAISDGIDGIKTLLVFLGVIATVIALTLLISFLRSANKGQ